MRAESIIYYCKINELAIMELDSILDSMLMQSRTLRPSILQASKTFPVILLTGPRQLGIITLLRRLAEPERGYVTLNDMDNGTGEVLSEQPICISSFGVQIAPLHEL